MHLNPHLTELVLYIWMVGAADSSASIWKLVDSLRDRLVSTRGNDPNFSLKKNIVSSLEEYAKALDEKEEYEERHKKLQDELDNGKRLLREQEVKKENLDREIRSMGIDTKLKEFEDLKKDLEALKQLELQAEARNGDASSQMKNNRSMLEDKCRALENDLKAIEHSHSHNSGQLETLKMRIREIDGELFKYDHQASLKSDNAKNAMKIADLENRNVMLRLQREAHEREYLEAENALEKLKEENKELEIEFEQLSLNSEKLRDEKAKYDAYMEKLRECEDVGVLCNDIKDLKEEIGLTEDLVKVKSAELENLVKLSKELSENLKRCQRLASTAENLKDSPGSIASLQNHASRKCKDLAESIQTVYHRKAEYIRTLEDRCFLENLVSAVLAFFAIVAAVYLFVPSVVSIN